MIVVMGDLVLIVFFALAMQFARWAVGGSTSDVSILVHLS